MPCPECCDDAEDKLGSLLSETYEDTDPAQYPVKLRIGGGDNEQEFELCEPHERGAGYFFPVKNTGVRFWVVRGKYAYMTDGNNEEMVHDNGRCECGGTDYRRPLEHGVIEA